jgi:hypothetical protein
MLEDLSLLYVFGLMFCLKEFNLERSWKRRMKAIKNILNKRCKTKKTRECKMQNI